MSTGHAEQEDRLIAVMEGNSETVAATISSVVTDDQPEPDVVPWYSNVLECFICMGPPTDPVSTSCGHVFCWPCLYQWLQNRRKPCPICRHILWRDLDIIPLYGAGAGPSHGTGSAAAVRTPESDSIIIPPRPRNPLLGMGSPFTGGPRSENFIRISRGFIPNSVLTACYIFMNQLSDALLQERRRVHRLMQDQVNLERRLRVSEIRNTGLRRTVLQRDRRISFLRTRGLEVEIDLLERNLELVRDLEESRAREEQQNEMQDEMLEYIVMLQHLLDRANDQLPSGWSDGL